MPLPNCLILGAQKAGTTALFDWMKQHPDIYAPEQVKSFAFFTSDIFEKGLEFYSNLFNGHSGQKIILASDQNLLFYEFAAERLYNFKRDLKFIIIFRDPVMRAYSAFRYAVERDLENRSFSQAIGEELSGRCNYNTYYQQIQKHYVSHGFYSKQTEQYFRFFKTEQFFFALQEDLLNQPEIIMKKLLQFLGVDENYPIRYFKSNETAGGSKFKFINRILHNEKSQKNSLLNNIMDLFPAAFIYNLRRNVYKILARYNKKITPLQPIDASTKIKLHEIFIEDIIKLEQITGRELKSKWLN